MGKTIACLLLLLATASASTIGLRADGALALRSAEREGGPTRLLRTPSVSANHVAFAYANNIWIVDRKGGDARRLTSFQGQSLNPKISPDGSTVAFSADYAGNVDVYTVPVTGGEPQRLTGVAITTDVLPSLGVSPTIGRTFTAADEEPAAPATVILSYATWRRLFNADPGIIGRHVLLDDQPSEVIGVMPPAFQFPERDTQFWTVLQFTGGGMTGQAGALRLGVARALNEVDEEVNRPLLKKAGLLTRDARIKERKKAGLKKARKAPQYSKR